MLPSLKGLFALLQDEECDYCIYKGLDHLSIDLEGQRGDLDILVPKSNLKRFIAIAERCGFRRDVSRTYLPVYMYGRDSETRQFIMLDIDIAFSIGAEREYVVRVEPEWADLCTTTYSSERIDIRVLSAIDYLPLMILMRISALPGHKEDCTEIKSGLARINRCDLFNSECGKLLAYALGDEADAIVDTIFDAPSLKSVKQVYRHKVLKKLSGGYALYNAMRTIYKCRIMTRRLWRGVRQRIFRQPTVRIGRGLMIAFVGSDGAGKSTTVFDVLADPFYSRLGTRRIYFGNNEFFLPFLNGVNAAKCRPFLGTLVITARILERWLRLLRAQILRLSGYIVLCDRYFYDDEFRSSGTKLGRSSIGRYNKFRSHIGRILRPRVAVTPDLTIFLDVSPEVAWGRKPDHDYKGVMEANRGYRAFMAGRKNVEFIDANREAHIVMSDVYRAIDSVVIGYCNSKG